MTCMGVVSGSKSRPSNGRVRLGTRILIKMAANRVVVTGLGLCTPLGLGTRRVWQRLINGESGVTSLQETPEYADIPSKVVGVVPRGAGEGQFDEKDWVSGSERRQMALCSVYALAAADEAITDAFKQNGIQSPHRTGVSIGSCMPDLEELVSAGGLLRSGKLYRRMTPYFVPKILSNLAAGHVSIRHRLKGPNHAVSTACATGLHTVGDAAMIIRRGAADVMIAGGTEACVHPVAFAGFCKAKALSTKFNSQPSRASRPFDSSRDGFVLSEGAGVVVLEELGHALQRNTHVYAELIGYGMSGDAHHVTTPSEDGEGGANCMRAAIADAGIAPEDIGHINAHATSTPIGDTVENRAIKTVFGEHGKDLLISATKGSIGHLLGASGSVEAIFTVLSVSEGVVPPTLNLCRKDPEFDLNYCDNISEKWFAKERRFALTNSFGFGGTNGSLCFAQY